MKRFLMNPWFILLALLSCGMCISCGSSDGPDQRQIPFESGKSTNAKLASMEFSTDVNLMPEFDPDVLVYTASVYYSIDEVSVTPAVDNRFATLHVNGGALESGIESERITLSAGKHNYMDITVTAENGEMNIYRVTLFRSGDSDNADLGGLLVSDGSLDPLFEKSPGGPWTLELPHEVESICVTPEAADDNHTSITVDGQVVASGQASPAISLEPETKKIISIKVTAQEQAVIKQYTLIVTRGAYVKSDDVSLAGIGLSDGVLDPAFGEAKEGPWTASVACETDEIHVTPAKGHPGQVIAVNGHDVASPVPLDKGENSIAIHVIAENGTSTADYQLTVTRRLNDDTSLSDLALVVSDNAPCAMVPYFAVDTDGPWHAVVDKPLVGGRSVRVVAAANDPEFATLTVNGNQVGGGAPSGAISLYPGDNTIVEITVTAEDQTVSETFFLTLSMPSGNANLTDYFNTELDNIIVSAGTLVPEFTKGNRGPYGVELENDVAEVVVEAVTSNENQLVAINGYAPPASISLTPGDNPVTVHVVAEDVKHSDDYTLIIKKGYMGVASLSSLDISQGTLNPGFSSDVLDYHVTVPSSVNSVTLTPTATDENIHSIHVDGVPVTNGNPVTISLESAEKIVNIVVVADDQVTSKTYTITIVKAVNSNTALSSLGLSAGTLSPLFSENTNGPWTASVGADVDTVTITAVPDDPTASVELLDSAGAVVSNPVAVSEGTTEIWILVTAMDSSTATYRLSVAKGPAGADDDTLLSGLSLKMGDSQRPLYSDFNSPFVTGFSPEKQSYAAVVYGFDSVTVTASAALPERVSSIKINESGTVSGGSVTETVYLYMGKGLVTDIDIVVSDHTGKTRTYTIETKLLNIEEFYRGIYSPPMNKAYDEKWETIKPKNTIGKKSLDGEISGKITWWAEFGGENGILNIIKLDRYYDGQYGIPYHDNGFIVDGKTVGDLNLGYNGYIEGEGYDVMTPQGDRVAHMEFHIKVEGKDKVEASDSYTNCTYMGETQQMMYDSSPINPLEQEGYDWYSSWSP